MAGPGAAAEELPVLVGLYLTVSAIVVWLLLRALKLVWVNTLGALLLALGHLLQYHKGPIDIHWGDYFFDLDTKITVWMRDEIAAQEYAIGWFWHQTARIQGWLAHETWALARDAFHFGGWLVHTYVPTYVEGVTHLYHSATRTVVKQVTVVQNKTATIARTVAIPHAGELAWIHRHWKALTRAVAAAGAIAAFPPLVIPRILDGIHDIRARLSRHSLRLTRLEKLLGAAAFAGLMANALGLGHNWRCITRGNIGKLSRAICGLDSGLFQSLLGMLTAVVGTFSIVELAEANQKLLPGVIDGLGFLIEETPDAFRSVADDVLAEAAALLPGV